MNVIRLDDRRPKPKAEAVKNVGEQSEASLEANLWTMFHEAFGQLFATASSDPAFQKLKAETELKNRQKL